MIIDDYLDLYNEALERYSNDNYKNIIVDAKRYYFEVTGKAHEDDEDYESRMEMFNEWYILQFISELETRPLIKQFLDDKKLLSEGKFDSLLDINFSLFEFVGINYKKRFVCRDLLHNEKVTL